MNNMLQMSDIKKLCGATSYSRGYDYYKSRRVVSFFIAQDGSFCQAVVKGSKPYNVSILIKNTGEIEAGCNCPAFDSYYDNCKHVAAVLFHLVDHQSARRTQTSGVRSSSSTPWTAQPVSTTRHEPILSFAKLSNPDRPMEEPGFTPWELNLSQQLLDLFPFNMLTESPAMEGVEESRQVLELEIIVTTVGNYNLGLAVELKIGVKRLLIVQKIREFLKKLEDKKPYPMTKSFSFDPSSMCFREKDLNALKALMDILRTEQAFKEAQSSSYSSYSFMNGDRRLLVPPASWGQLREALSGTNARFEHRAVDCGLLRVEERPLPIRFQMQQDKKAGYQLTIDGIEKVDFLLHYGCAVVDGVLIQAEPVQLRQLAALKQVIGTGGNKHVRIPAEHLEPFLERAVPGLKTFGGLSLDQAVESRILQKPLQAKLYLDHEDEDMKAKLHFVYGDMILEPFHGNMSAERIESGGPIILRDKERESLILKLLEREPFHKSGQVWSLTTEEAQYSFLYHTLPELEKLAEVYMTPLFRSLLGPRSFQSPKATLELGDKTNWLEFRFEMNELEEAEIRSVLRSLVEKKKYVRLTSGALLSLEEEHFQDISRIMDELGIRKSEIQGKRLQLPVTRSLAFVDPAAAVPGVKLGRTLRQLLDNLRNPDNLEFELPSGLDAVLRDYQKFGFQWMKTLSYYAFGGILADDMGLGKTLQGIAYLQSEQESGVSKGLPSLIVAPASLIYNWRNELKKFAPGLHAVVVAGTKQERETILEQASEADIVITSYPLLRRDTEWYAERRFHALILDEAQAIKNQASLTAQTVKELMAVHRFALTGTPVENKLDDLLSIYEAVFPELFPGKKAFLALSREQIARKIRPFLLRRLKTDVLKELPDKIETLQSSELTTEQKKLYVAYLAKLQKETSEQLETEGLQKSRMKILAGLTRLRQLCCHPSLFVEGYTGGSGKLEQLLELLKECFDNGKRVLLFSQFTGMLGIIRRELEEMGEGYFYLDGQTPSEERVELCSRFNDGENNLFLISLKAGGTGLNLTGADTVILFDLWWNPAVEQQAADRAHRIGQKNVVQVIRLISEGTIEEKMYELQQKKRSLVDEVIQPGESAMTALTEEEIRELLMLGH